jgi:hypothetical protein
MPSFPWPALIIASLVPMFIVIFFRLFYKRVETVLRARIKELLDPAERVVAEEFLANFFGLESRGRAQLRGNGGLILTEKMLHFVMLWPKRHIQIPLHDITGIEFVRRHCGKTIIGRDLLKVCVTHEGRSDAFAWFVPNPREWKTLLDTAVRERQAQ